MNEQCDIAIDVDSSTLETIRCAAGLCDQTIADFVIEAALRKAIETLLTDKVAFLSDDAYHAVCREILLSDFARSVTWK
ncbi:MAG: DUF1778 domain-containing protein [Pseudomonas sp.]|nr:DUF1778 domain-containing protein [Pseudomonas sp.]